MDDTAPARIRPLIAGWRERTRALDTADVRLRRAAARAILRAEVLEPADLALSAGLDRTDAVARLARLEARGLVDRDASGRVVGAYGITHRVTWHRLTLRGAAVHTWCALDGLAVPAALGADARLETACGACGAAQVVDIASGRPAVGDADPRRVWLAQGGADRPVAGGT
jgi:hypothetical protein